MGDKPREELMSSLKELYTDGEYSDLTITCRNKHYRVHRAIVCPRSEFFASACRGTSSEVAHNGIVKLTEDDPMAVEMVVHYLYHLDYPSVSTVIEDKPNGHVNGNRGQSEGEAHWKTNGYNGEILEDGPLPELVSEPKEEPASVEISDESRMMGINSKKDKKKRKKKKTPAGSFTEESSLELKDSPIEEPEIYDEPPAEDVIAPLEPLTSTNLITHAKVYALSKKYRIEALKALALEKFEDEVQNCWATDEFLQAAKVVYTATLDDDREIRDAVAATLYHHPELLDRKETQEVIKGLDLGFDLLMRVRSKGGFW